MSLYFPPITDNNRNQKPQKISGAKKSRLLNRHYKESNGICHWCSCVTFRAESGDHAQPNNLATLDHKIPRSLGGPDTYENTTLSCRRCNLARGGETYHTVTFAAMRLSAPNRLFGCSIVNGEAI